DRVLDRPAVRAAMADEAVPAHAQQRRPAVLLPVVLLIDPLHHRLELLDQAGVGIIEFGHDRLEQPLRKPFGELKDNVANESVAHDDIDNAAEQVASLDITDEV